VCENLCVVDYAVNHGCGDCLVTEAFTHRENGRFAVIISDAFSYLVDTN
jgi:hypothetical protein